MEVQWKNLIKIQNFFFFSFFFFNNGCIQTERLTRERIGARLRKGKGENYVYTEHQ